MVLNINPRETNGRAAVFETWHDMITNCKTVCYFIKQQESVGLCLTYYISFFRLQATPTSVSLTRRKTHPSSYQDMAVMELSPSSIFEYLVCLDINHRSAFYLDFFLLSTFLIDYDEASFCLSFLIVFSHLRLENFVVVIKCSKLCAITSSAY